MNGPNGVRCRRCERPPIVLRRWMGASGAVVGRGHADEGLPCQDVAETLLTEDLAAIAVSDGAGSAVFSADGAGIAVKTTLSMLRETLPWRDSELVGDAVLFGCQEEIRKQASAKGCEADELAATLAFVAISGSVYVAGSLGDGVVVVAEGMGSGLGAPKILFGQDRGEYANETVFLTSDHARRRLRIVRRRLDADGFMVMSDGSAESLFLRSRGTPAPAVSRVLSAFNERTSSQIERELAKSVLPMLVQRTRDDCSLAVLRQTSVDVWDIDNLNRHYQMEVLGCRSAIGVENRLAVLECVRRGTESIAEMCEATSLSETTVRRHRRALGLLGPEEC